MSSSLLLSLSLLQTSLLCTSSDLEGAQEIGMVAFVNINVGLLEVMGLNIGSHLVGLLLNLLRNRLLILCLVVVCVTADGTMNETAIPAVTEALQVTEGISNLKVQVLEGIATVELKKQTTVQATGVASILVEVIHGSGFKLQTLNLEF